MSTRGGKPCHPYTNKPIPTGRPSGNAHQRRIEYRRRRRELSSTDIVVRGYLEKGAGAAAAIAAEVGLTGYGYAELAVTD